MKWIRNNLLKATIDSYKAQKSEAIAHLEILFKNSVGIGEHTDILVEVKKWTESLSQAEENIKSLIDNFDEYGDVASGGKNE
tara:strand:- start:150 stop:395 length:246 start_codon:yes stop_codon:yes gene_type:complete